MNNEQKIAQNMMDAGCSENCIRSFIELCTRGETVKAGRILEKQRKELLKELHESQRKIDCLDYLCWCMKKEGRL